MFQPPSLLNVLELIEKRSSMYLGWGDAEDDRQKQLWALQALLTGYGLALRQHNVGHEDLALLDDLETFLRQKSGADNLSGIDQICVTAADPNEAWSRVWSLVAEFRLAHVARK
jgi:hypothetical protein